MALRTILVVVLVGSSAAACGGGSTSGDPQTAKEKQALEAKEEGSQTSRKWGGWRYKGDRNDCFFVVGRQCYKTEAQACTAAKCKAPKKCDATGAGPATVACK